jgi:hypothetical protein
MQNMYLALNLITITNAIIVKQVKFGIKIYHKNTYRCHMEISKFDVKSENFDVVSKCTSGNYERKLVTFIYNFY